MTFVWPYSRLDLPYFVVYYYMMSYLKCCSDYHSTTVRARMPVLGYVRFWSSPLSEQSHETGIHTELATEFGCLCSERRSVHCVSMEGWCDMSMQYDTRLFQFFFCNLLINWSVKFDLIWNVVLTWLCLWDKLGHIEIMDSWTLYLQYLTFILTIYHWNL